MKKNIFRLFICLLIFSSASYAQEEYRMNEIVVTASRTYPRYRELLRDVTIIKGEDLEKIPSSSLSDILNYQAGVDIQQRGYNGVQGDISIRGASFEQVLVLIDGIRMNDMQTGHHNLDIPVAPQDIERIEIMQGHSSSIYGSGAFGGVINIITKSVVKGTAPMKLSVSGGDFGLFNINTNKSFALKNIKHFVSVSKKKSSGYMFDTQFDRLTLYSKTRLDSRYGSMLISLGYLDNDFGANNFYGQSPSKEHTKTVLASISAVTNQFHGVTLEPKFHIRKHKDRFIWDINRPEIYDYTHNTVATGGEIIAKIPISMQQNIILGTELNNDIIKSPVLGDHTVTKYALIFEYGGTVWKNFIFNAGLRGDYQSDYSLGWYPTLSAGYWFSKNFKLRSSVGRSFRVPTFTELYYKSPSNIGNPYLKPEKGWSYEVGSDLFIGERISMQSNIFYRKQSEIIDWISENNGSLWNAKNIGRVDIKGFEQKTTFTIDHKNRVQITYSYTASDFEKEFNYLSKYVFRYPVHQFSFLSQNSLPYGISGSIGLSLKKRKTESAYNIVNVRLDKKFRKNIYHLEIMNIFNQSYYELIGVPAPGRWFNTGITFEF